MQTQKSDAPLAPQLKKFAIQAVIVFSLFVLAIYIVTPDLSGIAHFIRKNAKDEKTRVTLLSFIQNPAALYRVSEVDERDGKINNAVIEMELAIGLLEMHNANQLVISRYSRRLELLNAQLQTPSLDNPAPK